MVKERESHSYQVVKLIQHLCFEQIMLSPAWSHNPPATKLSVQSLTCLPSSRSCSFWLNPGPPHYLSFALLFTSVDDAAVKALKGQPCESNDKV